MTPPFQRLEFAEAAAQGLSTMPDLCGGYSISRRVGYKWLARYAAAGTAGLTERSRCPATSPAAVSDDVAVRRLACRERHPTCLQGLVKHAGASEGTGSTSDTDVQR